MSQKLIQSKSKVQVEPKVKLGQEEPKKKFGGLFSRFRKEK